MSLSIYLLGKPRIERDGSAVPSPKGRKPWALLAYLLRSHRPVTRSELASLMFGDADDPLGALRWNLAELRRLLCDPELLRGDQITLNLSAGSYVDTKVLESGTWVEASAVPALGRDLLEGMDFRSSAAFEAWLLNERRHLHGASQAVLREATLFQLAAGNVERAVDLATRLVGLEPLDEAYQGILIRAYIAAGDPASAERQLRACTELFRQELGVDPGSEVTSALQPNEVTRPFVDSGGEVAAQAMLEAGEAAVKAGALEAGLECLQRATAEAQRTGSVQLRRRALFGMGSILVHCGRNRYEDGARFLHESISLSDHEGSDLLQASAYRELAWAELLTARYSRLEVLLDHASELAGDDLAERSAILFVRGMGLTETGTYGRSIHCLQSSIEMAEEVDDFQRMGLALSMLGKAHVFRRELTEARVAFDRALELFRSEGWTWLVPWTEAYLAELEMVEGRVDVASDMYEHAFALASQINDPCFKSKSEAGLGLIEAERGNIDAAMKHLESARMWLVETPDHTWTMACALDSLCKVAIANGIPGAERWVSDLESLSGRTGMRELLVHAYMHRHALGDPTALRAAQLLVQDVDNPYLHERVGAGSTL